MPATSSYFLLFTCTEFHVFYAWPFF
jgi:hypothetical protein